MRKEQIVDPVASPRTMLHEGQDKRERENTEASAKDEIGLTEARACQGGNSRADEKSLTALGRYNA
jgi:hypothetical protein